MPESNLIDDLNRQFAIAGIAAVVVGNGGLPKVRITTPASSADIYLHGAQVTSWKPQSEEEVIFLSEQAQWADGRAIRGGIPICFPWFRSKADDPHAPAHGFVRTRQWHLDAITKSDADSVTVACSTESDESTNSWWPHPFRLVHRITIAQTLALELIVTNTGNAPFRFEEALHTYFKVRQVQNVSVRGLDHAVYLDNTDGNRRKIQSGDVAFTSSTDSAYMNTQGPVDVIDSALSRVLRTEKGNSSTTIVWNPWQQGTASLKDLGKDEWSQMVCVEASNILDFAVSLAPGEQHILRATISSHCM